MLPKIFACLALLSLVIATPPQSFATEASAEASAEASESSDQPKCEKCEGECKCAACEEGATVKVELPADELAKATHEQVGIINVNIDHLPKATLNCFCLDNSGRILAGCGTDEKTGEIRVFEADGNYVESWSVPVMVEAVNVRATDGMVVVAGGGKLVKLSPDGNLVAEADAPHIAALDTDALREEVKKQMEQVEQSYKSRGKMFTDQAERIGGMIEKAQEELANVEKANDAEEASPDKRTQLEQQIVNYKRQQESLRKMSAEWAERIADMDFSVTEDQIDDRVEASIQRKRAVASVSAVGSKVYVATNDTAGYGYAVWMCDDSFENAKKVVGGLRGCCGQMDVQASEDGIYVAENSRHRVACFDDAGELTREWGGRISDDSDIDGFGSCCNPMNLAFGPDGNVYTAEDNTGRIKCYSAEGKLLSHVGHADLVPGCKKVSIGVSRDGVDVYMLDITRNHIVHMKKSALEKSAQVETKSLK